MAFPRHLKKLIILKLYFQRPEQVGWEFAGVWVRVGSCLCLFSFPSWPAFRILWYKTMLLIQPTWSWHWLALLVI